MGLSNRTSTSNSQGFALVELLLAAAVVLVLGVAGVLVYNQQHKPKSDTTANSSTNTSTSKQTAADPYAGWKIYASTVEKVTFKYPADWTVDAADQYASNDPTNHDYIALKSPSGNVVVRWTSEVDGFGGEPGANYPLSKVFDKTPISGASNDYVVSGITTLDGSIYYPWIAVENDATYGALSSGVNSGLALFMGHNNVNPTTEKADTTLFSTSGPRVNEGAPGLSEAQAQAYLSNADMQQAKLILASLSY
jgi:hypothetical protein